jgi:hypothetical protein
VTRALVYGKQESMRFLFSFWFYVASVRFLTTRAGTPTAIL